jgi:uncharacterized protein YegL
MLDDGKIQALNNAIAEALPHMREVAQSNPGSELLVRALTFSTGAQWHVPEPTPVSTFQWQSIGAGGETQMGRAFKMLADVLKMPPMDNRALPPVLVLVSDGMPTDDYRSGLDALMSEIWARKSVRLAIGIGRDADLQVLQSFINNSELHPLEARNADQLVNYIRWAATTAVSAASSPASTPVAGGTPVSNVPLGVLPDVHEVSGSDDDASDWVW